MRERWTLLQEEYMQKYPNTASLQSHMYMLMDILPFLGKLSWIFQTKDLDLSKVTPIVKSTCDALLDFKEAEGMYVDKLDEFIIENGDSVLYRRPDTESRKSAVQGAIEVKMVMDGFSSFDKEHEGCNFEEEDNGGSN